MGLMERVDWSSVLTRFYKPGAHGADHAFEVSTATQEIASRDTYKSMEFSEGDLRDVEVAAIFHDTGYGSLNGEFFKGTKEEHGYFSVRAFLDYCEETEYLANEPESKRRISWLIFNHDDTQYRFGAVPFFERDYLNRQIYFTPPAVVDLEPGTVRWLPSSLSRNLKPEEAAIPDKDLALLQIIQEADGLTGTAQRTLDFAASKKIQPLKRESPWTKGVGMIAWQESGAASAYIAALRALLDSVTQEGFEEAVELYNETASIIQQLIQGDEQIENAYQSFAPLTPFQIKGIRCSRNNPRVRWRYHDWGEDHFLQQCMPPQLLDSVVSTAVRSNQKLPPNKEGINYRVMGSLLIPIENATYMGGVRSNSGQVNANISVYDSLLRQYGIDLFTQIHGGLLMQTFDADPVLGKTLNSALIRPPVALIEASDIRSSQPPNRFQIATGPSWLAAAKELDKENIRVLLAMPDFSVLGNSDF